MATVYRVKGVRKGQGEQIGEDLTDRVKAEKIFELALSSGQFDDIALGEGTPNPGEPAKFDWKTIRRFDRKSDVASTNDPSAVQKTGSAPTAETTPPGATTPIGRYVAIGAGMVAAVAIGAAVFFALQSPAPRDVPPIAVATAPNPPPTSASAPPAPGDVPVTEFQQSTDILATIAPSAAYVAPSNDAPKIYPIKAGTPIEIMEKSKDGQWVVVVTEDGQAAFLPTADLGPYMPPKRDDNAPPDTVNGPGKVIDTATLKIGAQQLSIAGIVGEGGAFADQLQSLINSQGPTLHCARQDEKYVCKLPNGGDIARLALFNGAARAGPDASADYQQQASSAQTAHRGVWK